MTIKDVVITSRTLWKHPAFTLTAVLTIALGVGASTAIFSVTNAVLLRPLPYKDPGRLVIAGMDLRKRNVRDLPLSNADYIDLREGTKALFSDLAGVFTGRMVVSRDDGTPEQIRWAVVTTNFFQLTGGQIQLGRDFTPQDGMPQPPATNVQGAAPSQLPQFAILSYEYFQKRFGGNSSVLGHTLTFPGRPGPVIAGVLANQRTTFLAEVGREQTYFTDAFLNYGAVRSWAIRTGSDPSAYAEVVRQAIKEIDPNLLVTELETADSAVDRAQAGTRFSLLLISVFAVVAVTLAGIGLYGVLSTVVRQRTSEVGVRMALGAERSDIIQLIVLQGLRLSAVGIALGIVAAFLLGRVIAAMLVGVKSTDPATFAAVTMVFLAISALASWLPARRAANLGPTKALREQ